MTQRLATFAPNDVTIILTQESTGISHILSGFSEDSIISIERNSDTFELYTGADDTNTRIYKANTSATLTVPLQQTSNSNDVLTQLYVNDKNTRDSSGLFSITVKDNSGRSNFFAEEAYIAVVPNSAFGNSMQLREWVIHAVRLETYIGGNSKLSADDQATLEALGVTVDSRWT
jgi:hypothetical protein